MIFFSRFSEGRKSGAKWVDGLYVLNLIQWSGVIRDRVIGDKKAVLRKVLPWVIGDTSDFAKSFALGHRGQFFRIVIFTKMHINKLLPG